MLRLSSFTPGGGGDLIYIPGSWLLCVLGIAERIRSVCGGEHKDRTPTVTLRTAPPMASEQSAGSIRSEHWAHEHRVQGHTRDQNESWRPLRGAKSTQLAGQSDGRVGWPRQSGTGGWTGPFCHCLALLVIADWGAGFCPTLGPPCLRCRHTGSRPQES